MTQPLSSFRRPREVEVLIACVEANVPIHFQIHVALLRIVVHRAGIGDVSLIGVKIQHGQRPGQDVHRLWNTLAFEPVGSVLSHGIAEDRRGKAHAGLEGAAQSNLGNRPGSPSMPPRN